MPSSKAVPQGHIRLATSSPSTQPTTKATLHHLRQIAHRAAARHHADLLLLPEAYIGGYPRGSGFGSVVGSRSAEGRDEFLRYFEQAADLGDVVGEGAGGGDDWVRRRLGGDGLGGDVRGDGTREELESIAADTGVFIVTGLIEKAGGSLYCAAVYVCPKRGIIGKRRKVMPRLIWAQGSPRTLQAVSTTIRGTRINMAAAICWESYMPLLRQALYAQNINLYLAPTADGRDAWLSLVRTVGIEGRCFVVTSNMTVHKDKDGASRSRPGDHHHHEAVKQHKVNDVSYDDGTGAFHLHGPESRKTTSVAVEAAEGVEHASSSYDAGTGVVHPPPAQKKKKHDDAKEEKSAAEEWISRGGSAITGPFGDVLAGPSWEDDTEIIYADVDFKDSIRGRLDLDAGGSYSRNDSFKFSVQGLDLSPLPY
ncbi:hypothetical protein VPNG_07856 [Cytospora leucostoma]|uniref:CN hydrolase domain-containing protein n=1 Tax=Cytospora leucostoma TaxID=1230097 RepID=A0A423WGT2_9PEZI|nr:hypothetical protein VPNG_07856 [Cytospora leucostoma]